MNSIENELQQYLKEQLLWDLVLRKRSEVIQFKNIFYCTKCYLDKREIIILRKIRGESNIFNCPYCSTLKKYNE